MQRLVSLSGTIPITYHGSTYNIPVLVWCMSYHPAGPPVMFVTPTRTMMIRERHEHVDSSGLVYLPYLSNWDPVQSNIKSAIMAMAQVFSHMPPVYSQVQRNPVADEQRRLSMVANVSKQVENRLRAVSDDAMNDLAVLLNEKDKISRAAANVTGEMREISAKSESLNETLVVSTTERDQLEEWITKFGVRNGDVDVDHMIYPQDVQSQQQVECLAEDAALSEALNQLDEALSNQVITLETFMKETRRISRDQFFARALLRKVRMHQAQQLLPVHA